LSYAKWQFWATGYDKGSKVSRIDNLNQIAKTIGKKPKQLEEKPELSEKLMYLWVLFVTLKNASSGAISYPEIQAYMAIYGDLSTFEVDAIRALDTLHSQETNTHG
tara:strand:- start:1849 stop:2166 length:318 start_codon:yes stop_codon:yes gene_type:complete